VGATPTKTNGDPIPTTPQVFYGPDALPAAQPIWMLTLSFGYGSLAGTVTVSVPQNRPYGSLLKPCHRA